MKFKINHYTIAIVISMAMIIILYHPTSLACSEKELKTIIHSLIKSSHIRNIQESDYDLLQLLAFRGLAIPNDETDFAKELFMKYKNDSVFAHWFQSQKLREETTRKIIRPSEILEKFKKRPYDKNRNKAKRRTWDLTGDKLNRLNHKNPIHVQKHPHYQRSDTNFIEYINEHDEILLLAREGDTLLLPKASGKFIEYNEREFFKLRPRPIAYKRKQDGLAYQSNYLVPENLGEVRAVTLGKFINSGNQTFVFEIKDRPQYVLRLPFRNLFMRYSSSELELDSSRQLIFSIIEKPSTKGPVKMVEVDEYGPNGEFSIVKKVLGNEEGGEYYNKYEEMIAFFDGELVKKTSKDSLDEKLKNKYKLNYKQVKEIYDKFQKLVRARNNVEGANDIGYRQFVYDRVEKDWVLVDY